MGFEAWLVIIVVSVCFALLASNRYSPDLVLMAGLTVFLLSGVITTEQALAGLANEGMVTVGVLFIVISGFRETGGIHWIVQTLLGVPRSLRHAQFKVMAPVAMMSAFLNNTPVVAAFIPAIEDWAKRYRLPTSKLMMPLSYAAIAGGTCTLIGTSTNLVVNGLINAETDYPVFAMFDPAWVGLPVTLAVFLYVFIAQNRLLAERTPLAEQLMNAREYVVEMLVEAGSPLPGKSVIDAGLRQLPGLYLIEVRRNDRVISAVSPHEILQENDRLIFVGVIDSVVDLQRIPGLKPASDQLFKLDIDDDERFLNEAVVSNTSPLIGKSVRENRFRNQYNAAILAVARNGQRLRKKIGDIRLRPGDTLLMVSDANFVERHKNSRDFFLVHATGAMQPVRHRRAPLAFAILLAMVLSVAVGWLSIVKAAMLAAGLMIISGCTTGRIARRAVDWQLLIVIAASFGIAMALYESGAATGIASGLLSLAQGIPLLALALVFLATALLSSLATNNAAAVVMFPIALSTAENLQVSFTPFAMILMLAASASFATPIGYQTNLMVYGSGGYRFTDFVRFGGPLTLLVGGVSVAITPLVWPF